MHRIDHATAAPGDLFTEGNPNTATPATVVTAKWLNAVQEELANFIESRGLTLDDEDDQQLIAALSDFAESSQTSFSIANNQSNQNITGLSFDIASIKDVVIEFSMYRKDSLEELSCTGKIYLRGKPTAQSWEIEVEEVGDDCGIEFSLNTAAGVTQLRYTSDNMAGAGYTGTMRYKLKKFKI